MPSTVNDKTSLAALPESFVLGDKDVVIGKGKKFFNHAGNSYLRTVVASMMNEYSNADTKPDKSNIISDVVEHVRQTGSFVKRDISTGKWVYAEDLLCREKCSQTFRDALHQTYRSSNIAKKNKRRLELQQEHNQSSEMEGINQAKRMRYSNAVPVVPALTSSRSFGWEELPMLPLGSTVSRRASDLTGNMMSALMDTFGVSGLGDEDENPFEPTPLLPVLQDNRHQSSMMMNDECQGQQADTTFEQRALSDNFQLRRNNIFFGADFSVMSDIDGSFWLQHYQNQRQQRDQESQDLDSNISAAFAA